MRLSLFRILPLLCISALAACSGGSSTPSVPSTTASGVGPTAAPTTAPTTAPIAVPAPLATATLNGSPGFVNTAQHSVYVFDLDLSSPNQSTCNGGCAQVWPPVAPPAGATVPSPWSTIMRTDGTKQLTYAGRPLYTFVADTQPGQTNGDGIVEFGGLWHIARPQAVAATPASTSMPPGGY